MSEQETDLLREIEEDIQKQKFIALWQKWGNTILTGVILIVALTACYEWWNTTRQQSEQNATSQFLALTTKEDDSAKNVEELQSFISRTDEKGVATLARLRAAADANKADKKEQALEMYNALSEDKSVEKPFRDLANLMAVQLQMDTKKKPEEANQLITRLQPLLADDCAWRYAAKENTAHILLGQKKKEEALRLFESLMNDQQATDSIRSRAQDMALYLTTKLPNSSATPAAKKP